MEFAWLVIAFAFTNVCTSVYYGFLKLNRSRSWALRLLVTTVVLAAILCGTPLLYRTQCKTWAVHISGFSIYLAFKLLDWCFNRKWEAPPSLLEFLADVFRSLLAGNLKLASALRDKQFAGHNVKPDQAQSKHRSSEPRVKAMCQAIQRVVTAYLVYDLLLAVVPTQVSYYSVCTRHTAPILEAELFVSE